MVTAAESVMPIGAFTAGRSSTAPLSLVRPAAVSATDIYETGESGESRPRVADTDADATRARARKLKQATSRGETQKHARDTKAQAGLSPPTPNRAPQPAELRRRRAAKGYDSDVGAHWHDGAAARGGSRPPPSLPLRPQTRIVAAGRPPL